MVPVTTAGVLVITAEALVTTPEVPRRPAVSTLRPVASTSGLVATKLRPVATILSLVATKPRPVATTLCLVATKLRAVTTTLSLVTTKHCVVATTLCLVASKLRAVATTSSLVASIFSLVVSILNVEASTFNIEVSKPARKTKKSGFLMILAKKASIRVRPTLWLVGTTGILYGFRTPPAKLRPKCHRNKEFNAKAQRCRDAKRRANPRD